VGVAAGIAFPVRTRGPSALGVRFAACRAFATYKGTSPMRNDPPVGPYSRDYTQDPLAVLGWGRFLMSEAQL